MSDGNGQDDDDTPARPYRLTKNPEAMWFVRQLANYELALTEALRDIKLIADAAADDADPPSDARLVAMSRAAADIGAASNELAYGINPAIDRRKKVRGA